jgi:hypothetical protein
LLNEALPSALGRAEGVGVGSWLGVEENVEVLEVVVAATAGEAVATGAAAEDDGVGVRASTLGAGLVVGE